MKYNDDKQDLGALAYKAYFGRKQGDRYYFNYDIYPLIDNFSFTEFLSTSSKTEHGAFLVITNNQYVIGYTASFGIGTHNASFARVMKDLTGGGVITTEREVKMLKSNCDQTFITARITYDYKGDNEFGTPKYSGSVYFKLPEGDTITKEQFEIFKTFYNDYNKELEILITKHGIKKFNIQFDSIDLEGTKVIKIVDSLNELYTYLESRIDNNKELNLDNEVILSSNSKIKKR